MDGPEKAPRTGFHPSPSQTVQFLFSLPHPDQRGHDCQSTCGMSCGRSNYQHQARTISMVSTGTETNIRLVAHATFPQQVAVQRFMKRAFDLLVTLPTLLLMSPLFLLIALWIKLDSRGPVFFRQVRVGRNGLNFRIFKFRTMVADADQRGAQLTVGADHRITRSGHFLRRYKIDELPQLINVLLGEMTLVGPRPEVPHYVAQYVEHERAILALTPGITSPASLAFCSESELLAQQTNPEQFYLAEVMPAKIRTDLAYARHASWRSDVGVLFQTALRVLR